MPDSQKQHVYKLGARNVLDEGQRIMEKHNMKYDEVKVCDMTKKSVEKNCGSLCPKINEYRHHEKDSGNEKDAGIE